MKDYLPRTREEKIITHADNLIDYDKEISLKKAMRRFENELGKKYALRIKKLADEVEGMKKG